MPQLLKFSSVPHLIFILLLVRFSNSHAAPDFGDLINEVVRGHAETIGVEILKEFSKYAIMNGALGLLRSGTNTDSESDDETADQSGQLQEDEDPVKLLLRPLQNLLPKNKEDAAADPKKYIKPIELLDSCLKSSSKILDALQLVNSKNDNDNDNPERRICTPLVICNAYEAPEPDVGVGHGHDYCVLQGSLKSIGVCCPEEHIFQPIAEKGQGPQTFLTTLNSRVIKPISKRFQSTLTGATRETVQIMKTLYANQEEWIRSGNVDFAELPILNQNLPEARDIADGGIGLALTTLAVAEKLTGTSTLQKQVPAASVLTTKTGQVFCPLSNLKPPSCQGDAKGDAKDANATITRTIDGSCNNLQDPTIGETFQPLTRLTKSAYDDGVFSPRRLSQSGKSFLPSARKVSSSLVSGESLPSPHFNFAYASFGQFIAYDLSHTAAYDMGLGFDALKNVTGKTQANRIRCCTSHGEILDDKLLHPLCDPIEVSEKDDFYSAFGGVVCMPFVRSMISSMPCALGAAQQMNQATHWLDLSQVYGSLERISNALREHQGGRLKELKYRGEDYLILNRKDCNSNPTDGNCAFQTGDSRANFQQYLTIFHTLWRREHNRIANSLENIHSEWSDEKLFQESRRIAIAEYQHIVYNEFVPQLIGASLAKRFYLQPKYQGNTVYNPSIDASVSNEFSTAAFRIGFTMMPDFMKIVSSFKDVSSFALRESIETPLNLVGDGIQDGMIRGMTRMPMKVAGPSVSKSLTEKLFKPSSKFYGMDLVALTIQRGRDHGLPSYSNVVNSISEYCGVFPIPAIQSFADMASLVGFTNVEKLKTIYKSYRDVDLYMGGIMEVPLPGGQVGPTFGCLIADQFSRSKYGDGHYYEHGDLISSFSEKQLQEIRSSSSARIFCDNANDIKEMQPLGLKRAVDENPLISCANFYSIPTFDINAWL